MYKKIISFSSILLIIVIGYLQKDELLVLIKHGGILSVFISVLLVAICVIFPVIPFTILAGIIAAVFGVSQGVVISLSGSMIGTMAFFFLSRYGFRDYAQEKLRNYPKVQEYEEFLERNSIIAILTCRLIPVIPAPVVNLICGLSKVNWIVFFTASAIGKIPNILMLSFAGASFTSNKFYSFSLYGTYWLIIFLIAFVIMYRRKH